MDVITMHKPVIAKLKSILEQRPISLHVPGHKNNTIGNLQQLDVSMDMTEITGLDDLHHPEGIMQETMENLSKHKDYDAFLLVNGTTSGIMSVIQGFASLSGSYIIARNAHKSVFHGLELANGDATLLPMQLSKQTRQYIGPDLARVDWYARQHKLAILTYPNYYGECFDIASAIQQFKDHNIPVLIDEAHGAHFCLPSFPQSTMTMGADYVVQSYHKTLPALTMSSVLYIHKNAPMQAAVRKYLSYFQTSSPSYLMMSSLELAHEFYETYDNKEFRHKREQIIAALHTQGFDVIESDDPLKLVIQAPGYNGYEIQQLFENEAIYVELADELQALLILPLWHENDSYPFDNLVARIRKMQLQQKATYQQSINSVDSEQGYYKAMSINKTKLLNIEEATGYYLAQHIVPYPPGIPIMFQGEKVTENMIELMRYWSTQKTRVEGMKDNKIEVKDE